MAARNLYKSLCARRIFWSHGRYHSAHPLVESLEDRMLLSIADGTILVTTAPSPFASESQAGFPTGIIGVDPDTGEQSILSTDGVLSLPTYIAETPDQQLYVTDLTAFGTGAVIRLDPNTGQQSVVAKGGMINGPNAIALVNGSLYVANAGDSSGAVHTLVKVDPRSGRQTLIADGSGGGFSVPVGMAPAPGNNVFVADEPGNFQGSDPGKVWEVNLDTGQQSLVSSNNAAQGMLFDHPVDIALDTAGNIIVANTGGVPDNVTGSVFRVDPVTGVQTLITRFGAFSGTNSIVVGQDGTIFVGAIAAGSNPAQIIAVDPVTGAHSILTSGGNLSEVEGLHIFKAAPPIVPTAVTLASSADPSVFGQNVIFTATIDTNGATSTPTGTVQFFIDGNDFGTPVSVDTADGVTTASVSIASLTAGTHTVAASYSGDPDFAASDGTLLGGQSVDAASTITTLTSSANPSPFGQPLALTATITVLAPGAGTPSGTVQFVIDNNNADGPVNVSPGGGASRSDESGLTTILTASTSQTGGDASATLVTSGLSIGTHSVAALYSGDNNFTGSGSAVLSQVVGTPDERFLDQVYLDLLQRAVDPVGLASWTGALAGGASRFQVVASIEASQEYETNLVQSFYQLYLHRTGEDAGVRYWLALLQGGGSVTDLRAGFVGSPEYFQARGNGTNDGFLDAVYQDTFSRAVDPSGQNSWGLALSQAQLSRADVARAIFSSPEYRQDLVESDYQRFLRRPADQEGLNSFVTDLETGASEQTLIAAIVGSDEYFARV